MTAGALAGRGEAAVGRPAWMERQSLGTAAACRLAVRDLARRDERLFWLAATDDGADRDGDAFPGRVLDGLPAAALIGAAGGLALAGKVALVDAAARGALLRACEQVRLDLCYHHADAKIFGRYDGAGADGATDGQVTFDDLAVARSLPNLTVIAPADATAAYHAAVAACGHAGPVYLRVATAATPRVYGEECPFAIGRGIVLRQGDDLTLVAAGAGVVAAAVAAADLLREGRVSARVIDLHTLKPIDRELLARAAAETGLVITVEEHSTCGGLGGAVAEVLGEEYPVPMRMLGVPDGWSEAATTPPAERLRRAGLDAPGIAAAVRRALGALGWEGA